MPVRRLPSNPDLDHLKHQARDLMKSHAARDLAAAQRIREFHPRFSSSSDSEIFAAGLKLSDAQLTIAREAGFASWTRLKRHIEKPTLVDKLELPHHERIEDPAFRRAVDLLDAGDVAGLREQLSQHPKLATQRVVLEGANYFRNPALLEFIAENPIRHGKLAPNILEIARVIVEAGVAGGLDQAALDDTLALVATGSVAHESGSQVALMDLLCDYGASANSAIQPTVLHGYGQAIHALFRRGARMSLPVAAALGLIEDFRRLLPAAGLEARHLALATASQHGQVQMVRELLDAGEDPNRYHPPGGHSHCTPLHQAALEGNFELAQLLIDRGARLDMRDILFHGTPAEWAAHVGRKDMEAFLRAEERRREIAE